MYLLIIFLLGCAALALAYHHHGSFLERSLGIDATRKTPAHTRGDGVDFVPTRAAVLFGHHFSSIAGAGPIVGPIIAALAFGWAPALVWILIGAAFIGGTHDFTAMVASIRHGGRSIGEICRQHTGPFTYTTMLVFIALAMVYVIIVFLDLTASSFAPMAAASASDEAVQLTHRQGGAVATASLGYIGLALAFGLLLYRAKVPLRRLTLIFVPLVFAMVFVGIRFPLHAGLIEPVFGNAKNFWAVVLLIYCFTASVLPVWILLQPRDFLSSFLLYACLGGGVIGLMITALTGTAASIQYPAMLGWTDPKLGALFPALFITIACGAVSGFHAIVASGTSSKQLDSEASARPVAYGSMLVEGVLALLALATVMILPRAPGGTPVQTFASGLGVFLSHLGLPANAATVFALMAVSTFLLTTLDTCTRLARMILQELFGLTARPGTRYLATAAVLAVPSWAVFQVIPGADGKPVPAWNAIWPAFGASNQLLAALALLVIYAWLRTTGRRALYAAIPAAFMCITTVSALVQLVRQHLLGGGSRFVGAVSLVLIVLAAAVITALLRTISRMPARPQSATEGP